MRQWLAGLKAELETMAELMAAGEAPIVEARAKALLAFARAIEGVAEIEERVRQEPMEQDVEERRAALELRISRFLDADRSVPVPGGADGRGD